MVSPLQASAPASARGEVLPVSLLVSSARLLLEQNLPNHWVSGEISNFTRAASGHCYFILKDERAQVRCVLFRHRALGLAFKLEEGLKIEVRALATIYEARGEFQLNIEALRLAGLGSLYEAFSRLKAKLEAQGWFDPARKRALPQFPRCVGVITSPAAAAWRDILSTLGGRFPALEVILYPTPVQGVGAAEQIAAALGAANMRAECDVLIVARGGGSIEDLWAFNEEVVAEAIFRSGLPVVSGVGHETDFTIADFVADQRAPTPTGAAMLVAPDGGALSQRCAALATRLARATARTLERRMQQLDILSRRLTHPAARLNAQRKELAQLAARLRRAAAQQQERRTWQLASLAQSYRRIARRPLAQEARLLGLTERLRQAPRRLLEPLETRLQHAGRALALLDPQQVLDRGYAIATNAQGEVLREACRAHLGETLALRLARGSLLTTVVAPPDDGDAKPSEEFSCPKP